MALTTGQHLGINASKKAQLIGPNSTTHAGFTDAGAQVTQEGFDALGRPIVQANMAQADKINQAHNLRIAQKKAHDMWANAAAGNGPNIAQRDYALGLNNVMQQQAAASQPGLAALAAARQGGGVMDQLNAQAGGARNAEQQMYNQQMGAMTNTQMQDENTLGVLGNKRAADQAQLGLASNGMNLDLSLGKLGIGAAYNDQGATNRTNDLVSAWDDQLFQNAVDKANYGAGLETQFKNLMGHLGNTAGKFIGDNSGSIGAGIAGVGADDEEDPNFNPKYGF